MESRVHSLLLFCYLLPTLAGARETECATRCKAMNEEARTKCEVRAGPPYGHFVIMVGIPADAKSSEKLQMEETEKCFIRRGVRYFFHDRAKDPLACEYQSDDHTFFCRPAKPDALAAIRKQTKLLLGPETTTSR